MPYSIRFFALISVFFIYINLLPANNLLLLHFFLFETKSQHTDFSQWQINWYFFKRQCIRSQSNKGLIKLFLLKKKTKYKTIHLTNDFQYPYCCLAWRFLISKTDMTQSNFAYEWLRFLLILKEVANGLGICFIAGVFKKCIAR